jgi:hypothetical protein
MRTKADELQRQQYLVPRQSVKKLREMSRREGVSAGEIARRAIDAYTSGRLRSLRESAEEEAALAALRTIHEELRATLERIDASLVEVHHRERALRDGSFRTQIREETKTWLENHPEAAETIAELFSGGAE